eukprot:6000231-Pyramimonas_sp.AAC.1
MGLSMPSMPPMSTVWSSRCERSRNLVMFIATTASARHAGVSSCCTGRSYAMLSLTCPTPQPATQQVNEISHVLCCS